MPKSKPKKQDKKPKGFGKGKKPLKNFIMEDEQPTRSKKKKKRY